MKSKTKYSSFEKRVIALYNKNYGRRRIAKKLNVTEWSVRQAIDKFKDDFLPEMPEEDIVAPKPKASRLRAEKDVQKKNKKKTSITIKSSSDENPIQHKPVTRPTTLKVAVLSDIHYPYEDQKACEVADLFLEDWKPDVLVYNGDIADCYAISSYTKDYKKKMNIQDELDYATECIIDRCNRLTSVKQWLFLEGNHENRFKRGLNENAKQYLSLREMNIETQLRLEELGIQYVPGDEELEIGDLLFTHGHITRKHAGASARGHHEQYGGSVLIGHCHRLGVTYKRNKYGHHALIENGTLCDFDVEYTKYPDWQHGFTTVEYDGDDFVATSRPIINHKLIANGKVYAV